MSALPITHLPNRVLGRKGLVDRYFYFAMSLAIAGIVVLGFGQSVDDNLFHPDVPRPTILWLHAGVFSGWVLVFIAQSLLIRTHKIELHRLLGWFGTAVGAAIPPLGVATGIIMSRFHVHTLHEDGFELFLISPLYDMVAFATLFGLAVRWRMKRDVHRRLMFIATCCLLDAPFGRFSFIVEHGLVYAGVDGMIVLGVIRDLLVERRVHSVYLVLLPLLIAAQAFVTYTALAEPAWWVSFVHALVG